MITIRNTQRKVLIDLTKFRADAQKVLMLLDYADYDLGIWITNNRTIHHYNKTYRHKDKPTDILSFPYHPELKAGSPIKPQSEEDKNLGDLIISAEYVVKEAEKYRVTFAERLQLLLVHGVCHLLGYDHIEDADFRRMRAKEVYLLKMLNQNF
jgi:rRNA maturation RNase YbeY